MRFRIKIEIGYVYFLFILLLDLIICDILINLGVLFGYFMIF